MCPNCSVPVMYIVTVQLYLQHLNKKCLGRNHLQWRPPRIGAPLSFETPLIRGPLFNEDPFSMEPPSQWRPPLIEGPVLNGDSIPLIGDPLSLETPLIGDPFSMETPSH